MGVAFGCTHPYATPQATHDHVKSAPPDPEWPHRRFGASSMAWHALAENHDFQAAEFRSS